MEKALADLEEPEEDDEDPFDFERKIKLIKNEIFIVWVFFSKAWPRVIIRVKLITWNSLYALIIRVKLITTFRPKHDTRKIRVCVKLKNLR